MSDAVAPQDTPKKSFKLVATFVLAMKRFQGECGVASRAGRPARSRPRAPRSPPPCPRAPAAALNPTYTRGKRPEDDVPVEVRPQRARVPHAT